MAEFTGERVIPGEVNTDLWNEHLARYAFAARYAEGKRVLDVGCGAGYGSAQLARTAASVIGLDVAAEAVDYARSHYPAGNLEFTQGSCAALPVPSGSVDLVVAFELIEHVAEWERFLAEVRRVLAAKGQFIVSTPNKFYYGASRGPSGPNPYHVHEFEFDEFRAELGRVFPHAAFFLQNHADGIVFQSLEPASAGELRVEHDGAEAAESHFFIAVCGVAATPRASTFVYVPKSANVLRERELHIHRLEGELLLKDDWLEKAKEEHSQLLEISRAQKVELEDSNRWAEDLSRKLKETGERVLALQEELTALAAGYESKIRGLEKELLDTAAGYESKIRESEEEKGKLATGYESKIGDLDKELAESAAAYESKFRESEEEKARLAAGYESTIRESEKERTELVASHESKFEQSEKEKGELAAAYEAKLRESEQERARVAAAYESKIRELEEDGARTSEWALHTDALLHETEQVLTRKHEELGERETALQAKCAELESKCQELAACVDFLHAAEATLEERTAWALSLQTDLGNAQSELEQAKARLNYVRASRWVRVGRAVGIGPELGKG